MINLVCALHCEAKPLIDYYKLSSLNHSLFPIFSNKDINLLITGVGKVAMASAMAYLFVKTQEKRNHAWLNYGIAGHKTAVLGQWFNANKVTEISTALNWYPARIQAIETHATHVKTVDIPSSEYENTSLYDMEASAFMATALKFTSAELIQLMKVVSDNQEHHLEKIDKKHVAKIMNNNLDPLLNMIDILQKESHKFETIYGQDALFITCLDQWHFTQYQQKELIRLIQRWRILCDESCLPNLMANRDSKQVILWFKEQLNNVEVVF